MLNYNTNNQGKKNLNYEFSKVKDSHEPSLKTNKDLSLHKKTFFFIENQNLMNPKTYQKEGHQTISTT
jgi:hypothetical protein